MSQRTRSYRSVPVLRVPTTLVIGIKGVFFSKDPETNAPKLQMLTGIVGSPTDDFQIGPVQQPVRDEEDNIVKDGEGNPIWEDIPEPIPAWETHYWSLQLPPRFRNDQEKQDRFITKRNAVLEALLGDDCPDELPGSLIKGTQEVQAMMWDWLEPRIVRDDRTRIVVPDCPQLVVNASTATGRPRMYQDPRSGERRPGKARMYLNVNLIEIEASVFMNGQLTKRLTKGQKDS